MFHERCATNIEKKSRCIARALRLYGVSVLILVASLAGGSSCGNDDERERTRVAPGDSGSAGSAGTASGGAGGAPEAGAGGTGGSAADAGASDGDSASDSCVRGQSCDPSECVSLGKAAITGLDATVFPFSAGGELAKGCYQVVYVTGSHRHTWVPQYSTDTFFYSAGVRFADLGAFYQASAASAEAATVGATLLFTHCGGSIGISSADSFFYDNAEGAPGPTWELFSCGELPSQSQ